MCESSMNRTSATHDGALAPEAGRRTEAYPTLGSLEANRALRATCGAALALVLGVAACGTDVASVDGPGVGDAGSDAARDDGSALDGSVEAPSDAASADAAPADVPDAAEMADGDGDAPDGDDATPDVPDVIGEDPDPDINPACPTTTNRCGGCAVLVGRYDAPCGECNDGRLRCDGQDALACRGEIGPRPWWPDLDRDGWGNDTATPFEACESPFVSGALRGGDCFDGDANVHPDAAEVCDGRDNDCDGSIDESPSAGCADACCEEGIVCDGGACLVACDEGTRCGAEREFCCDAGELCLGAGCTSLGETCAFTEDCPLGQICESTLGRCVDRAAVPVCEYRPPVGVFAPVPGCRWTGEGLPANAFPLRRDVVATPVVANLTDDNGDGVTDTNDTPDIVFLTYDFNAGCCNQPATIRIVSGQCGPDGRLPLIASISTPVVTNDSGLALADLDGDGVPEILAVGRFGGTNQNQPQGVVAFKRDTPDGSAWSVYWENTTHPTWNVHTRGGPVISVANITQPGRPDVIVGNVVLNGRNGRLIWDGNATSSGAGGIGNNAFLGPSSAVADIDLDGRLEVIAGNTVYDADGTVRWTYPFTTSNSACGGQLPCDGFTAVGNFDDDPEAEVVIVRLGEIFVLEHTGELKARIRIPVLNCGVTTANPAGNNEGGPPTVADFDGDGVPEIGVASSDYYVVADLECVGPDRDPSVCAADGIRWMVRNRDCSSRATGSSVFDFDGDGRAEVVYADERNFWILDGATGTVLFQDSTHRSHTRIEMPVVVDVDNDGNAEVVIPSNRHGGGTSPGITVWRDADNNWVRTRRIWNQHAYSVTHVDENGRVPRNFPPNWTLSRLNNFRQNVQPAGVFDAPDLIVRTAASEAATCPYSTWNATVEVGNQGAVSVAAGVRVRLRLMRGSDVIASQARTTSAPMLPGGSATVAFSLAIPDDAPPPPWEVEIRVDPDGRFNECDETNNELIAQLDCYSLKL